MRAFLAIDFSAEIVARLIELKDALAASRAAVRWVRSDGMHATVKFLGSVSERALGEMRDALAAALADLPGFRIRVLGLGAFPNLKRPRVLWAGVVGISLVELARRVEAAVEPFGFPPETRPFRAHVTLGRVQSQRGWKDLEVLLKEHWSDDLGECEIAEVAAYRSDLRRDGSIYTKLWNVPLDSPPPSREDATL